MTPDGRRAAAAATAAGVALLASLAVAFGARPVGDFGVETDFYGTYAPRAARLLEGEFDLRAWGVVGPLFETLLAGGGALGLDLFGWARVLSALATAGTALVWWRIAACTAPAMFAWVAPWLLLLSPAFVRHGYLASTDALHGFLFPLAVLLALRARSPRDAALAGAAALGATLARYAALPLLALPLLLWRGREGRSRAVAFHLAHPGALLILLVLLRAAGAELPAPDFLHNVDYALAAGGSDWEAYQEREPDRAPWAFLHDLSPALAGRLLASVPRHLASLFLDGAGPVLSILAVLGVAGLVRAPRPRPPARRPLLVFAGIVLLALVPFPASERYALPLVPFLVVPGTAGIAWMLDGSSRAGRRIVSLALAGAVAGGLALNARDQARSQAEVPAYLGRFSAAVLAPGPVPDVILARKPHLPYLVGSRWAWFPDAPDLGALRDRLRRDGITHVYFGTSEFALRPRFRFLAFPPYAPPGWEVVHEASGEGVLYRVRRDFFDAPLPGDDGHLRALMNAAVSAPDPVPGARRLAVYLASSGRCAMAVREFERIRRFAPLDPEEAAAERSCRDALARARGGG